jgi:molecular chaperone DnaK (HSP70)
MTSGTVDTVPALGVDLGTTNTVAVGRLADGRVRPLLFDGSPVLPSAVYLDESGRVVTGRMRGTADGPGRVGWSRTRSCGSTTQRSCSAAARCRWSTCSDLEVAGACWSRS